jgi:hypothetical protein
MSQNVLFDDRVRAIRDAGVAPKCIRKKKSECTPEQWAAHREYMRIRYLDPEVQYMHRLSQLKYLARKTAK